jgi:Uncharacterized protein conserved in bacteria (DUF2188)
VSKNSQHVVPSSKGGWRVFRSGAGRAARVFDSQKEALDFARTRAKKAHADVYVHRRDGTIQERDSYEGDGIRPSTSPIAAALADGPTR